MAFLRAPPQVYYWPAQTPHLNVRPNQPRTVDNASLLRVPLAALPNTIRDDNIRAYKRQAPEQRFKGQVPAIDQRPLQPSDLNNPFGPPASVQQVSAKKGVVRRTEDMLASIFSSKQPPAALAPYVPSGMSGTDRHPGKKADEGSTPFDRLPAADRDRLILTIAGEVNPRKSPYGTQKNSQEIANIVETIRTRMADGLPMSKVLIGSQYNALMDSKINNSRQLLDKHRAGVVAAARAAINGDVAPTHTGLRNYHAAWMNPAPTWSNMTPVGRTGEHIFYGPKSAPISQLPASPVGPVIAGRDLGPPKGYSPGLPAPAPDRIADIFDRPNPAPQSAPNFDTMSEKELDRYIQTKTAQITQMAPPPPAARSPWGAGSNVATNPMDRAKIADAGSNAPIPRALGFAAMDRARQMVPPSPPPVAASGAPPTAPPSLAASGLTGSSALSPPMPQAASGLVGQNTYSPTYPELVQQAKEKMGPNFPFADAQGPPVPGPLQSAFRPEDLMSASPEERMAATSAPSSQSAQIPMPVPQPSPMQPRPGMSALGPQPSTMPMAQLPPAAPGVTAPPANGPLGPPPSVSAAAGGPPLMPSGGSPVAPPPMTPPVTLASFPGKDELGPSPSMPAARPQLGPARVNGLGALAYDGGVQPGMSAPPLHSWQPPGGIGADAPMPIRDTSWMDAPLPGQAIRPTPVSTTPFGPPNSNIDETLALGGQNLRPQSVVKPGVWGPPMPAPPSIAPPPLPEPASVPTLDVSPAQPLPGASPNRINLAGAPEKKSRVSEVLRAIRHPISTVTGIPTAGDVLRAAMQTRGLGGIFGPNMGMGPGMNAGWNGGGYGGYGGNWGGGWGGYYGNGTGMGGAGIGYGTGGGWNPNK